jgi:hypothetical protein
MSEAARELGAWTERETHNDRGENMSKEKNKNSKMPSSTPKLLKLYVLPNPGQQPHPALSVRRTTKNSKGRYVTGDQIVMYGLFWPNIPPIVTRNDLAMAIGQQILDEAGV